MINTKTKLLGIIVAGIVLTLIGTKSYAREMRTEWGSCVASCGSSEGTQTCIAKEQDGLLELQSFPQEDRCTLHGKWIESTYIYADKIGEGRNARCPEGYEFYHAKKDEQQCRKEVTKGYWLPETRICETEVIACPKGNTFDEDRRCHGTTPPLVTWAVEKDNELTWSAEGGDKVELRFGWFKGFYPFKVTLENDGHEAVGLGTDIGYWFNWFEMRTLNGCKIGAWTEFN